ncbi:MAG: hypothetical protein QM755_03050 [Luteolibacter sp.]
MRDSHARLKFPETFLPGKSLLCAVLCAASAASASATHVLIKFSSKPDNDISSTSATALGADSYVNVTTGSTTTGSTAAISVSSITGGISYADYYQQNQLSSLGQPFSTLVGAKLITAGTGTGENLSASIALDLSAYVAAGSYSGYKVTVYYAGRSASAETIMTDSTPDVTFNDGTTTATDVVTVTKHGTGSQAAYFGGNGTTHFFTGGNLTIKMNYLGSGVQAGISAIMIEGVPTFVPGSYAEWTYWNAGDKAANLDSDGDGVPNGVEYLMGETGSTRTANPQLVGGVLTWPKKSDAAATWVVEISDNLVDWVPAVEGVEDLDTSIRYTAPAGRSTWFVRLRVTPN